MDGIQNTPNYFLQGLNAYQAGAGIAQQEQQRQTAMEQQQRAEKYKQMMVDLVNKPNADAEDWLRLQAMFPEQSKAIKEMSAQKNDAELKNETLNIMQTYMAAENARATGDWTNFKNFTGKLIEAYKNSGKESDAAGLKSVREMADISPEAIPAGLMQVLSAQMGPEEFRKFYREQQTAKAKATEGLKGRYQPATEKGPDGTIWAMNDKGEVTVKDITGNVLEGEEAKKAWLKSKEYGVKIAEDTNYSRESGKLSAQKGTKAEIAEEVKAAEKGAEVAITKSKEFADQYEKIQDNIRTLDEGINIIEKGMKEGKDLGVGPLRRYLPKWGATANQLKNVSNRLGLNVVSSVTFGALSEKELEMATQTAMPTSLKGSELLQWMKDRKTAQEKLSGYLSEAARFIGSRGEDGTINTVQDWMDVVESKKTAPAQQQITATNPETGQKIVFKNGQWFDFKTNRPVQ